MLFRKCKIQQVQHDSENEPETKPPIFTATHLSTGVLNGTRHGTERERIAEHLIPRLQTGGLHHEHDSASAAVQGHAVLVPSVLGDLDLALRHDRLLALADVVTVHAARLHEADGLVDTGLGDGVRRLDVAADCGPEGVRQEGIARGDEAEDGGEGQLGKSGSNHD